MCGDDALSRQEVSESHGGVEMTGLACSQGRRGCRSRGGRDGLVGLSMEWVTSWADKNYLFFGKN